MASATLHPASGLDSIASPMRTAANDDHQRLAFAGLLLAVATLFLRPSDLLIALDDWAIYQVLIGFCLILSYRGIYRQLTVESLRQQPVTVCLVLLVVMTAASHLADGFLWGARMSAWMVIKVLLLYLLISNIVDTPQKLVRFATWLALAITCMASLSLLDDFGYLSLASLEPIRDLSTGSDGSVSEIMRLRGTGIFHDPNDLGLILVPGFVLCCFKLGTPRAGMFRYLWLVAAIVLLYALVRTQSRGTVLSFAAVIPVYLFARYGWKATLAGSIAVAPLLAWLFAGRMTDVASLNDGTGQSRIRIWSDHLMVFRENPFFGLGEGMLVEDFGVVSHNSFLHCFAETGFVGGTAFLAAFVIAASALANRCPNGENAAGESETAVSDSESYRLRPFVTAAVVGYAVGLFSLSRQFEAPTFLILGFAVATQKLTRVAWPKDWTSGGSLLLRSVALSALLLLSLQATVMIFIRR